jgi:hypothetical protein
MLIARLHQLSNGYLCYRFRQRAVRQAILLGCLPYAALSQTQSQQARTNAEKN